MALNNATGSETQSALTATTNGTAVELRGYSKLAIQTVFATCTGTANTATLTLQTSNNNSDWSDLVEIAAETDAVDFDSDTYTTYLPDQTVAGDSGFCRYIRLRLAGSGTFSVSYTWYYIARE